MKDLVNILRSELANNRVFCCCHAIDAIMLIKGVTRGKNL